MKLVVIGGTGLIGRALVALLQEWDHDVVAASPSTGVDAMTGAGLVDAMAGASVVVDVSNAPSFADEAVLAFFRTGTTNVIAAAREAGVAHVVALSVVGTDRLQASGYFRAKLEQERIVASSGLPFTIVRATQFFEFLATIADGYTREDGVHLPRLAFQPVTAADVSSMLAEVAIASPAHGIVDVAGPERGSVAEFVASWLGAHDNSRRIVVTAERDYFGATIDDDALVPGGEARIMPTRFNAWLHTVRPTVTAA